MPHDVLSAFTTSAAPAPAPAPNPNPNPNPNPDQVLSAFTTSAVLNIMFTQIGNLFQIQVTARVRLGLW